MARVAVIGTGFVGLAHAAATAHFGNTVYAYDIDKKKIEAYQSGNADVIKAYVDETGLPELIFQQLGRNLHFTLNLEEALNKVDAVFLCTPTPPKVDSYETDLSFYDKAAESVCNVLANRENKKRVVLVNKSTVPIGTAVHLEEIIRKTNCENVGAASNPEFLPEGEAVKGSKHPERIAIGASYQEDFDILDDVYANFLKSPKTKIIRMSPESAEAVKYVANTRLLTQVSFTNGILVGIGESIPGVEVEKVREAVGSDSRIGYWGLYPSNGAGGSCFGKDIKSLITQMAKMGASQSNIDLLINVLNINEHQKTYLLERADKQAGFDFNNKTIAILGLAFKQDTNDMRDASSIDGINYMLGKGATAIRAYDRLATHEAQKVFAPEKNNLYSRILYCNSVQEALKESHAVYICNDSQEFNGVQSIIEEEVKPKYLVIDGRRMINNPKKLIEKGFTYIAVGSPTSGRY